MITKRVCTRLSRIPATTSCIASLNRLQPRRLARTATLRRVDGWCWPQAPATLLL
ncbi:hypothetical protein CSUI_011261 [Cystoisospora suis]|uniref:Uncharacterized protein n=1 Tax=Cystoisospora suis TaxID=483139 RepID=A0A2C6K9Y3_9APIC|nr:hypothetical protein CSUI_011261 [Cystoisospora suis]